MNNFVALDTCLLCNKEIGVVINKKLKPTEHGPHSLSLCDECKQELKDNKQILIVECMLNKKEKIKGITGRVAYTNEKILSPEAPMYNVVMNCRVLFVSEEIFNKMMEVKNSYDKA